MYEPPAYESFNSGGSMSNPNPNSFPPAVQTPSRHLGTMRMSHFHPDLAFTPSAAQIHPDGLPTTTSTSVAAFAPPRLRSLEFGNTSSLLQYITRQNSIMTFHTPRRLPGILPPIKHYANHGRRGGIATTMPPDDLATWAGESATVDSVPFAYL
ncbi:hypothetical protein L210DRAFT_709761 [Boletus edulis BED1]|uniref:Uncharacterized protein n=1 Tax=Boletus edulis BED1 TaxID=1328754 RepID=A0AAD4C415_BOLED|nr:hypothetical protein L210DRAFT_709761 [Boletus edulis BED1]